MQKIIQFKALLWKAYSNQCGDCEGYCFQEVDAKWSEIIAQAFLQLLLPPSSWQPHSMIRTDCKNFALVKKMNGGGI